MTDARLPGRWLVDATMDGLSDRAWRTFTGSLMHAAEQGSDGLIGPRQMRLLHPEGVDDTTTQELVAAGLWEPQALGGVRVLDWEKSQSTAEQVEAYRERSRAKQKAYRDRKKLGQTVDTTGNGEGDKPGNADGDVTGDIPGEVGKAKAKAKALGKARLQSESEGDLDAARLRLIESRFRSSEALLPDPLVEELPDLSQPNRAWAASGYDL